MQTLKFVRDTVATCAALVAIIVPAAKATGQTQPTEGAKTVLLIHGAWADGSSWSKVIPLLEAKGLQRYGNQAALDIGRELDRQLLGVLEEAAG